MTTTEKQSKAERREQAIATLRSVLKQGDTVYTILRHVARSGMLRRLDVYAIDTDSDGKPWLRFLSGAVSDATGITFSRHGGCREDGGLVMRGCGYSQADEIIDGIECALGYPANSLRRQSL